MTEIGLVGLPGEICPGCTAPIVHLSLAGRAAPLLVKDCTACRLVWFDSLESVQLAGLWPGHAEAAARSIRAGKPVARYALMRCSYPRRWRSGTCWTPWRPSYAVPPTQRHRRAHRPARTRARALERDRPGPARALAAPKGKRPARRARVAARPAAHAQHALAAQLRPARKGFRNGCPSSPAAARSPRRRVATCHLSHPWTHRCPGTCGSWCS